MGSNTIRVLAVEDSPTDLLLLKEQLSEASSMDFEVTGAETLREAVQLLQTGEFAVVLLDLVLSDNIGLEGIQRILTTPEAPPIIVLTGMDSPETGLQALSRNAQDYLVKGKFDSDMLVRSIRYSIQRDQAEKALRGSEHRLKRAQEIAHLGSWELVLENDRLTWSDEVYRIFGLQPQIFGATYVAFLEAVHPDDRAAVDAAYAGSIREGRDTYEIEHRVVKRSSGEVRIVHEKCEHFRNETGKIIRSVGMVHDITERKQAEEALRKAHQELELRVQERTKELADANRELLDEINERREIERQLRVQTTALESAANGVIITGRHGNIRWANPAFLNMTGYCLDEVLGQNLRLLKSGRQEAGFYRNLWDTILAGKVWRGEIMNRRKDGSLYIEEQTITPLVDENGNLSNFIAIKQDVTERKQAEAELERRNLELEAISASEHKQRQIADTLRASAQALAQTLDLDAVLHTLLKHVQSLVQSDTASVILLEGESLFAVRAVEGYEQGIDIDQLLSMKLDGETNPCYQKMMLTRRSLLIPDTAAEPSWVVYPGTELIRNCILAPIVAKERAIGIVVLGKTEPNYFTEEHIKWAEALVGQAAVAIQNAWLFEQVRAGRERLQSLSRRLVEVQETERRFIARELHDQAGQTLTCLILGLGALEREADEPQKVRSHTTELKSITHNVLKDLHRLAISLRPASLDQLGLVSALEQLIESFAQNSLVQIRFKAVGICEDDRLPHEVETTLYRIAQEALTNVIRHAGAQRADVVLERRGDMVLILIEDDGKGFDVESAKMGGPLGLLGMQERAEMLGGALTVESTEGKGTTLVAEVPCDNTNYARG